MIAGGLTAVTVPHAIHNQAALTKLESEYNYFLKYEESNNEKAFRDVLQAIRKSVNTFANTNKDLRHNANMLENQIEQ